jgi:hypothetical protein
MRREESLQGWSVKGIGRWGRPCHATSGLTLIGLGGVLQAGHFSLQQHCE